MCLGEVVQVVEASADGLVLARTGTRTLRVSLLTLDGPVAPGDWLLAHSGFALARLGAAEADEALALRDDSAADRTEADGLAPHHSTPSPVPMEAAP